MWTLLQIYEGEERVALQFFVVVFYTLINERNRLWIILYMSVFRQAAKLWGLHSLCLLNSPYSLANILNNTFTYKGTQMFFTLSK